MRVRIQLVLLISFLNYSHCQNTTTEHSSTSTDFLARVLLEVSESKVPEYIVDIIYDRPEDKGISPKDIFDLYRIQNLTLNATMNIIDVFNSTPSQIFSVDNLNHTLTSLNTTFTNFYDLFTKKLGIAGMPLRNALLALQINSGEFSNGIAFGEPDPFKEFAKGNFTKENLENASVALEKTFEDLFQAIRDIFTSLIENWDIQNVVRLLLSHSIDEHQALLLWDALNITLEDIKSLDIYRNIIGNFSEKVNNQSILGAISGDNILINRKSYDLFRSNQSLLDIIAETVESKTVVIVDRLNENAYENVIALKFNNTVNLTSIELGYISANQNLTNCTFITMKNVENGSIETFKVDQAFVVDNALQIPQNSTYVVLGSALVCDNHLYGLAREATGEAIVLDAFVAIPVTPSPPKPSPSAATRWSHNIFLLLFMHYFIQVFRD